MKNPLLTPIAAFIAVMTIAACTASTRTSESAGQYIDSSAITSKVKADLLGDSGLKSFAISVATFKDVVQLSGSVDTPQVKARATEIAAAVPGVRAVQNDLVVQ